MQYETVQINKPTGKYITEPSKFKHIQIYMSIFVLEYRNIERLPQIYQLFIILQATIEEVFETLEKADAYM